MIKVALINVLGLALIASLSSASYRPTDFSTELSSSAVSQAQECVQYLDQLDAALRDRLPHNEDVRANMEVVIELYKSANRLVHGDKPKAKALKMVASLEEDSHKCDHKSFRVLAENLIALETLENKLEKADTRIRSIFDHYHKRHASHCNVHHIQEFQKKRALVDAESLRRVEGAFEDIKSYRFIRYDPPLIYWQSDPRKREFLREQLKSLSEKLYPEATHRIGKNIVLMVKENPKDWDVYKPYVDAETGERTVYKTSKVLDEYLFKPCAKYEKVLGEDMSAARLDALLEKVEGPDFMADRADMYKGMVYSKLCKMVLKKQSQLREVLAEEWYFAAFDALRDDV